MSEIKRNEKKTVNVFEPRLSESLWLKCWTNRRWRSWRVFRAAIFPLGSLRCPSRRLNVGITSAVPPTDHNQSLDQNFIINDQQQLLGRYIYLLFFIVSLHMVDVQSVSNHKSTWIVLNELVRICNRLVIAFLWCWHETRTRLFEKTLPDVNQSSHSPLIGLCRTVDTFNSR